MTKEISHYNIRIRFKAEDRTVIRLRLEHNDDAETALQMLYERFSCVEDFSAMHVDMVEEIRHHSMRLKE